MKFTPRMARVLFFLSGLVLGVIMIFHVWGALLGLIAETSLFYRVYVSIQLALETLILYEVIFLLITIGIDKPMNGEVDPDVLEFDHYPDVHVVLPIRFVPVEKIEKTIKGFMDQSYPKEKIHVVVADDTPDEEQSEVYRSLCAKYSVEYFYRPENKKYKAGMLNLLLPTLKHDYACFYDYDQVPTRDAVKVLVWGIMNNPDAAYVQLKKEFRGLTDYVNEWSALLYLQFFELLQPRKEKLGVALFAGSTAIFRLSALREIGGFSEETFTEDTDTSFKLLASGKRGKFLNFLGSIGDVPHGYSNQISQVWRWSHGGTNVLRCRYRDIMSSPHLSFQQKTETLSIVFMTPVLFVSYVYGFSFIPLILMGFESQRAYIYGVTTAIFIPASLLITYTLFVIYSISKRKMRGESEFKYSQILGFIYISISSNLMLMDANFYGFLGLLGPNSPRGKWTRKINIKQRSIFLLLLGIVLSVFGLQAMISGFPSGLLIFLVGTSLFPPFIISFIQRK